MPTILIRHIMCTPKFYAVLFYEILACNTLLVTDGFMCINDTSKGLISNLKMTDSTFNFSFDLGNGVN